MQRGDSTLAVDRGVALHKMIRLVTATTINGGYLNFMGNEFGHPEWIDFPREGNGWSYKYARRQWNLVDNEKYLYKGLGDFDRDMIALINSVKEFNKTPISQLWDKEDDQVLVYQRDDLVFVFNFNGSKSFSDYGILADKGSYKVVLNTDENKYGGFDLIDESIIHFTLPTPVEPSGKEWLKLYIPARTAFVLRRQ
jgi:1,4-alpha-glucan branching enzyme